jgi:triacylglycerol lipase
MKVERRNPVLLVHGIKDTAARMEKMAAHLRRKGWDAHTITLRPNWGQVGIEVLARQVEEFVRATFHQSQRIDLVGFSMGGLVCRYFIQRLGGLARLDRFIAIASPHHGSLLAWLWPGEGCRQMRPRSGFLRDLNSDIGMLENLKFTSLWTPLDLMVVPASSSRAGIGREVKLWMPAHPLMVLHPRAWRVVADLLAAD